MPLKYVGQNIYPKTESDLEQQNLRKSIYWIYSRTISSL